MPKDASQPDSGIFGPAVEAAELRALDELVPYARNSRRHSPEQVDQLVRSMETYGWTVPILVDPDGGVIAGHGRILAAQILGWTRVPCLVARGWSAEQKRLYVIADNQLALNADWDEELLALELGELRAAGLDISLSGFDADALAAMLDPAPERGDPEAVPEVPVVAKSRIGDLYVLGEHRLLCGDATKAADVARLLGDVTPHLMVTDPPYGVEYDPTWREKAGVAGAGAAKGKVLNDDRADWRAAWALFSGEVAYVWHAGLFAGAVGESLVACDFTLRSQIIWAKSSMVLSRGDYHWQHEPCQPAGTMVQKVIERGAGSQPAHIQEAPIETLRAGDFVVSYNPYASVARRRGREISRIGKRQFEGFMHAISAGGRVTRTTPEHRFSVRLNPDAAGKQVVYLMRCGEWWRVGRVGLFNTRGFGLATRLADNCAEEAWIISVHDNACEAQCAEQVLSCRYGIPTTHWEVDVWSKTPERQRSPEMIAAIYASLNLSALAARATLLLRDHRLERDHPLISQGERLNFSRRGARLVRACNVFAKIMQVPAPTEGEDFAWLTITGNDATPFSGPVYSMDVERDHHYVADGLVTHNCWYAVRKGKTGHYEGGRKQTTLWQIDKPQKSETGHSTQKPVECMQRPIENNSKPGDAIYEPFSGSGTTIIAGEITGRRVFAMELSAHYVDVAVERWEQFTGGTAKLVRHQITSGP